MNNTIFENIIYKNLKKLNAIDIDDLITEIDQLVIKYPTEKKSHYHEEESEDMLQIFYFLSMINEHIVDFSFYLDKEFHIDRVYTLLNASKNWPVRPKHWKKLLKVAFKRAQEKPVDADLLNSLNNLRTL